MLALWLGYIVILATAFVVPRAESAVEESQAHIRNANHIFNAIHSSMRQWGSSVNHNGMSFFLAQVPAGTQLYHGTSSSKPVPGREWLAFEPEHAFNFAVKFPKRHKGPPPPPSPGGPPEKGKDDMLWAQGSRPPPPPYSLNWAEGPAEESKQSILRVPKMPKSKPGWLHSYKTKAITPLLYIDGMSAGKTLMGTLDSQDIILLNRTEQDDNRGFWEYERAQGLCRLAEEQWGGKIKGFIRMEAGFEIIMCAFEESLDFLGAVRAGSLLPDKGGEDDDDDNKGRVKPRQSVWDWIHAVASRYDGIGGGRVTLNYNNFVTSFYHDINLFPNGSAFPRLTDISELDRGIIQTEVDSMINDWDASQDLKNVSFTNWQAAADMIVERYAIELKYLTSGALLEQSQFLRELERMVAVFIDSDARDLQAEAARCVAQNMPPEQTTISSTAGRAVYSIATNICSTLLGIFDENIDVPSAVEELQTLMTYLNWTTWKRCDQCDLGRICFTPIWPFGSTEDYNHPQCRNESELQSSFGYWQSQGGPRP